MKETKMFHLLVLFPELGRLQLAASWSPRKVAVGTQALSHDLLPPRHSSRPGPVITDVGIPILSC